MRFRVGPPGAAQVASRSLISEYDSTPGLPDDVVEVRFTAPMTTSTLLDEFIRTHGSARGNVLSAAYEAVVDRTVERIQELAGWVVVDDDSASAGRLEIAVLPEDSVPGLPGLRLHHHDWVRRTAETLDDGRTRPVDIDNLVDSAPACGGPTSTPSPLPRGRWASMTVPSMRDDGGVRGVQRRASSTATRTGAPGRGAHDRCSPYPCTTHETRRRSARSRDRRPRDRT
jgi:hypothetical protein